MDNTIVVAIVSGLCVGIPSVMATLVSNNKNQALMNYKIEELSKRVEKHNNVVERMALQEQQTKTLWHEIDEIKQKVG